MNPTSPLRLLKTLSDLNYTTTNTRETDKVLNRGKWGYPGVPEGSWGYPGVPGGTHALLDTSAVLSLFERWTTRCIRFALLPELKGTCQT